MAVYKVGEALLYAARTCVASEPTEAEDAAPPEADAAPPRVAADVESTPLVG